MAALTSMGTTLSIGGSTIAQVTAISAVNLSADVADVTTLASTSGYEEAASTVLRSGEIVVSVAWDPDATTHGDSVFNGAIGEWRTQDARQFQVTFANSNASTWTLQGYVTGIAITAETTDVVRADFTFKTFGAGEFEN